MHNKNGFSLIFFCFPDYISVTSMNIVQILTYARSVSAHIDWSTVLIGWMRVAWRLLGSAYRSDRDFQQVYVPYIYRRGVSFSYIWVAAGESWNNELASILPLFCVRILDGYNNNGVKDQVWCFISLLWGVLYNSEMRWVFDAAPSQVDDGVLFVYITYKRQMHFLFWFYLL